MRTTIPLLVLLIACGTRPGAVAQEAPPRKLIQYGWDVRTPAYIRKHIRQMETRPFDGILFRLDHWPDLHHAFDTRPWDRTRLDGEIAHLEAIRWESFTDNFLMLYAANTWKMDWFNDEHWQTIAANMRLAARAAKAGRCAGVCFDPEPYGLNPWAWTRADARSSGSLPAFTYEDRTYAEVAGQVRRRGAQFIEALQSEMPGLCFFSFYGMASFGAIVSEADPERRAQRLADDRYGLVVPFLNGVLAAAGPGVTIVDGAPGASGYTTAEDFYRGYHRTRNAARALVDTANRDRYAARVGYGPKLFVDLMFAAYPPPSRFLTYHLTPEQRRQLFTHVVYHALVTADRYAWCYSERMNWWHWPGSHLVSEAEAAIRAARDSYERGSPLGIEIEPVVAWAQRQLAATVAARDEVLVETIRGLPPGVEPPVVNGAIDDGAWGSGTRLAPFVTFISNPTPEPDAPTHAWVTFDETHLYVAFRCVEPDPDRMLVRDDRHDGEVWKGDSVDVFISVDADPHDNRHFLVDTQNHRWDGEGADATWNGSWSSATRIGADAWTVEIAIPWDQLGGCPGPGAHRRANLGRHRAGHTEWSSWSPMRSDFLEFGRLGTWHFPKTPKKVSG